jgi:hypothetical protein
MTDKELIKRTSDVAYDHGHDICYLAVIRIERLVKERDAMLRVVTDNHVALQRAEIAEAKLAKAVAALQEIKSVECIHCTDLFNELADAALTEIKGE